MTGKNIYKDVLFGVAVGDALGVPVECRPKEELRKEPVTGMRGYGTYKQLPGTWSDDTSLTLCLADSLTKGFDLNAIGQSFVRWLFHNEWTARGIVFDVGITTNYAINSLRNGASPDSAGEDDEDSNGNGSLMRILPLLFYISDKPAGERFRITSQVSSLTHAHIRSVIACYYYLEFARHLLSGDDKSTVYKTLQKEIPPFLEEMKVSGEEISIFNRLFKEDISEQPEDMIKSGGYVIHTLEAAIWCILTTETCRDALLKAVNLGRDTDTTGAVTGGLAGLLYGFDAIPSEWLEVTARRKDIEDLADRLSRRYHS
jgi:ADP-ribosylglycohydrolase